MTDALIDPAAAAEELLKRRAARKNFLPFVEYTYHAYQTDPVHRLMADHLDQVLEGTIKRLMIFAPPQHGKSELVSRRFPAYWLGRRPEDPVILTSYGASLAYRNSREARDIVGSASYQKLFPELVLRNDSRAVDFWRIKHHRGQVVSAGVNGPITGSGAMLGIIDDPFKDWAEAWSQTIRDAAWGWWQGTFRTRIWEGGAIVLIMTRWHEDDLAGRLLNAKASEWTVLRLPALAETQVIRDKAAEKLHLPLGSPDPLSREPGDPLAPSRFSAPTLVDLRDSPTGVGMLAWEAEYQQNPQPLAGQMFNMDKVSYIEADELPADITRWIRYWDLAATAAEQGKDPDWTAGSLIGYSPSQQKIYVKHVRRLRIGPEGIENVLIKQAQQDGIAVSIWIEQEGGSAGKIASRYLIGKLIGFKVFTEQPTGNKVVRALPLVSQVNAGNVVFCRGDWNLPVVEEMKAAPNGTHDDSWDSMSGGFSKLINARQKAGSRQGS